MHLYKLSQANSLETTMAYELEALVPTIHRAAIDGLMNNDYLSLKPIQPLYTATPTPTPTSHAGSGAPIVHADWWVCCHCDNMNNPDLAPDRCSICQHYKCGGCGHTVV